MTPTREEVEQTLDFLDTLSTEWVLAEHPPFAAWKAEDRDHWAVHELRRLILKGISEAKVGQPMSELILANLIASGWIQLERTQHD